MSTFAETPLGPHVRRQRDTPRTPAHEACNSKNHADECSIASHYR